MVFKTENVVSCSRSQDSTNGILITWQAQLSVVVEFLVVEKDFYLHYYI
jgi:hypothetical protein